MKKIIFSLALVASLATVSCSSDSDSSSNGAPNAGTELCQEGLSDFQDLVAEYRATQSADICAQASAAAQQLVDGGCATVSYFQQYANLAECFEMPTASENEDGGNEDGGNEDGEDICSEFTAAYIAWKADQSNESKRDLACDLGLQAHAEGCITDAEAMAYNQEMDCGF